MRKMLGLLLALTAIPISALAQSCDARYQVAFQDGSQGCLSDFPLVELPVVGWSSSVRGGFDPRLGLVQYCGFTKNKELPASHRDGLL